MELGGVPQKNDEYVHLGTIFYVCSSARNWVSFMYKYPYFPLASSNPGCLQCFNKKQVPQNAKFLFILH